MKVPASRATEIEPDSEPQVSARAPRIRSVPVAAPLPRVTSVDAFRGAVIALMVFVNYLGGMKDAPWWTQHVARSVDGYTLTDLVFPWFLFLAGVSIPLSLGKYLGPTIPWRALGRLLPRAAGLILLGVVFVNEERTNAAATGMSRPLWLTLVLAAAVVLWRITPPDASPRRRRGELLAKGVAAVLLAVLLLIWRGTRGGAVVSLQPSWWGILGLIGWCYLVVALAFVAARGSDRLLLGLVGIFICVSIAGYFDRVGPLAPLEHLFTVREICGSLAAIVAAGAVAGVWVARPEPGRIGRLVALGVGLWAAGWLLRPLHGYHKLGASEGWALVAAGQATLLLTLFHLAQETRFFARARGWLLAPLALVGANALLAYILPDWLGAVASLFHVDLMPYFDRGGVAGVVNSALLTIGVLVIAALGTRRRFAIRL